MESRGDEIVKRPTQIEVVKRHCDARRHLHAPLARKKRPQVAHDAIEAAGAALVRPRAIVDLARTIEADGDGKAMLFEEFRVGLREQRAVGRDREAERDAAARGQLGGTLRHHLQHGPVDQRLAAQKGERRLAAVAGFRQQQVDRPVCGLKRHVLGLPAERTLLRIAVGAAEIAFLRDGEREGMNRWRRKRRVVDQRRLTNPDAGQKLAHPIGRDRSTKTGKHVRLDVEQPAAVGDEKVMPGIAFKQMDVA